MEKKHTPGPWKLNGSYLMSGAVRIAIIDRPEDDAGNRNAGLDWDEAFANARLMVAAPELLAALSDLMSPRYEAALRDGQHWAMQAVTAARAAIAKARA